MGAAPFPLRPAATFATVPSPTVENYLKAFLALGRGGGAVTVTDLAGALAVSKPTATAMAKSLAARGLVRRERYRPLTLTSAGHAAAAQVVRRHRLTEMFLVERMGFGWEEVHAIAEQVEHVDAPRFFARMDELMGFPTHDPHGSPIPTPDGQLPQADAQRPLTEVSVGERASLSAVAAETDALLGLLTRKGISLGTEFEVLEREPFDGSLRVRYGGREEVITPAVGRCLLVAADPQRAASASAIPASASGPMSR